MAGPGRWAAALAKMAARRWRAAGDRLAARRAGMAARPARPAPHAPEPLEIGDAEAAARLAAGEARLGGETARIDPRGPWRTPSPAPAWAEAMHGFDWLGDAAAGARADRARLALWAVDWARRFGGGGGPGWRPGLAGRRLARLACALPDLLSVLDAAGQRALLRCVTAHLRFLAARWRAAPDPLDRLEAATGLALGALAVEGAPRALAAARAALGAGGAAFADEDGPAIARDADRAGRAFCALAWSAAALRAAGREPDARHLAALAALGPALRALRLGDGAPPRFHGAGRMPAPPPLDAAFAAAGADARGPRRDGALGVARMAAGRLCLAVDAAAPPPGPRGGGSALAIELTAGRERLFGSVGPGAGFGEDWDEAGRATAAFSTVEVGGVACVRVAPADRFAALLGRPLLRAPRRAGCERAEDGEALWLLAEHDGYLDRFGLLVTRRLRLSRDGTELRGEDRAAAPTPEARARLARALREDGLPVAARFHLPPDLPAALTPEGVLLSPPDAPGWLFRAGRGGLRLTAGVWLDPGAGRVRGTRQIVVEAMAGADGARLVWGLRRVERGEPVAARADAAADAPQG